MRYLLAVVLFLCLLSAKGQTLTQVYVDPCTGNVLTVTVPLQNGAVTVVYRGQYRTVTAEDITSGALTAWLTSLTIAYPCPQQQQVVQQVVTQAVNQATTSATQAATTAAASAASSAASSSASVASSAGSSVASTSAPSSSNSSSSSSSESSSSSSSSSKSEESSSKSESKSEEKKESKSESKKSEKKSQAKVNPIMVSADFSVVQSDVKWDVIASFGASKSSLMGNKSWGATAMIWSNMQQFALSVRQTNMSFVEGKLSRIHNYSLTSVYAFGNVFHMGGYAQIIPVKTAIAGGNFAVTNMGSTFGSSVTLFYMKPVKINQRLSITPDVFLMGTPLTYDTGNKEAMTNSVVGTMSGFSGDLSITKRFKVNLGYKYMLTLDGTPGNMMFLIGSKLNL